MLNGERNGTETLAHRTDIDPHFVICTFRGRYIPGSYGLRDVDRALRVGSV